MKLFSAYQRVKGNPLILIAVFLAVALALVWPLFINTSVNAQDKYIITVFDRDTERSFATDAETVAVALERAEIRVGEGDIVEPGLDEEISTDSFNINIYRARTVTVVDGDDVRTLPTAYRSPEAIAEAAGLTVYPEDEYTFERVDDFIASPGLGLRLVIHRATPVSFSLYGSNIDAHTQQSTVQEFLNEQGVVLGEKDIVKPSLTAGISSGMDVAVLRVGKNTVTVEEDLPFEREMIRDNSIAFGVENVKNPGVKGLAKVTYEVTYYDGVEVDRVKIQSVTIEEPEKEVVVVGSKAVAISGGREAWLREVGIAESDWGYVDWIIGHEAGWGGVTKWNYAGSGAYGICQALPGSKMASAGADWATNGATQLRWCDGYAIGRYGSWEGAYNFWMENNWW